jgi:hypothetical protein
MSLTLSDFQQRFKKFGKLIFLNNLLTSQVLAIKRAHVGLVDEVSNPDMPTEYDVNDQVVVPLSAKVGPVITAMQGLPAQFQSSATTLLKKFVAVDLGLPVNATTAQLQTALTAQMNAVGATVKPAAGNATGFSAFFTTVLGLNLPENVTPTIPDTYITDQVV